MGSDNQVDQTSEGDTFEKFYGNKKYYSVVKRSNDYVENWIKTESNGKVFLDYACGNGTNARLAAKNGALLSLGLDISSVSIENAKKFAAEENLNNVRFFQADAENTLLEENSIDAIICSGMLHHLDLSYAFPELRRILKPGGKFYCMEFSKPKSIPLSKIYSYYKSNFIPLFGKVFARNQEAYNYLNESIDMFPNQEILKNKIEHAGFRSVKYTNLFDGIVSIHTGFKY